MIMEMGLVFMEKNIFKISATWICQNEVPKGKKMDYMTDPR
jgi:hypothetical protein